MKKLTIADIYAIAKISSCYSDFMETLGKYVAIPKTDSMAMDITLEDLCNK